MVKGVHDTLVSFEIFFLSDNCMDYSKLCKKWAAEGKCTSDKTNMEKECPHTCKTCQACSSKLEPSLSNVIQKGCEYFSGNGLNEEEWSPSDLFVEDTVVLATFDPVIR